MSKVGPSNAGPGGEMIVTPSVICKICCPVPTVFIHENGLPSQILNAVIAYFLGCLFTMLCWKAPTYKKSFV